MAPMLMVACLFLLHLQLGWSCPDQCLCLSQIQVLCNTGKLQEIPASFPPETQEITISHQNIRVIPPNAFANLKYLKKLVLDTNNITEIKPFAFKGLRDLEELSVQNNPLTKLVGFSFAGIRNVTNLMLGHNQINKIEGYSFAGTEHLQMLLLNNNPIKVVNSSAFSGLKHVRFLFLPAGVRNLESDAFNGLEIVDKLKLAYLDLSELKPFTFRGLKKLRVLSIENSDLATIRLNAFHGMYDVEELRIIRNKIDRIEDMSLPDQNMIRNIYLEGNHILEVPTAAALQDVNVQKITVIRNHFPCNCDVAHLMHSVMGNSANFLSNNHCLSPYSMMGKPMSDMNALGMLQNCKDRGIVQRSRYVEEVKKDEGRKQLQGGIRITEHHQKSGNREEDSSVKQFNSFSVSERAKSSSEEAHLYHLLIVISFILLASFQRTILL